MIQNYLSRMSQGRAIEPDRDIRITRVSVVRASGEEGVSFKLDEYVDITVEAVARTAHHDFSVVIILVDDHQYHVFDTCFPAPRRGPPGHRRRRVSPRHLPGSRCAWSRAPTT